MSSKVHASISALIYLLFENLIRFKREYVLFQIRAYQVRLYSGLQLKILKCEIHKNLAVHP